MGSTYRGKPKKYKGVPSTNLSAYATQELVDALNDIANERNVPKAELVTDALLKVYHREFKSRGIFLKTVVHRSSNRITGE